MTMKSFPLTKVLFGLLIVSVVTILSVEFVFHEIPELFKGGAKLGILFVNISLSYVAAYIFYVLTVVVPKRMEREHIKEHAAYLINRVLFYILFIMQDSTNMKIPQKDLKLSQLSEDDFKLAAQDVFMDNELANFRTAADGHNMKVGDAVSGHIKELKNTVDELFKYSLYIEPHLVSLISSSIRNDMNESWINSNRMGPSYMGNQILVPLRRDVSCYAKYLAEYQVIYRNIEKILFDRYSRTDTAREYLENNIALRKT
jgi:hypothetical protein